ncbi:MAG: ribonuclease III [Verrucomicrobiae bacterium]|nr:ribonuclease III [Verrucomicrobiae bacterium]
MDLTALQSRLGYQFKDEKLLLQSLTHPSYMVRANENESSNQRLEFLGDAVLQLIMSNCLYSEFPDVQEGQLTQFRSTLVKGAVLADLADELGLAEFLRVAGADSKRAPQELPSSREDALEALIGAIYLDSNLETTQGIVLRWYGDVKSRIDALNNAHNPKGRLQELLQPKISSSDIRYELIQESGPSHERLFRVELFIATQSCATGEGRSKKAAEEAAALKVLESFDSFDFSHA